MRLQQGIIFGLVDYSELINVALTSVPVLSLVAYDLWFFSSILNFIALGL